MSLSELINPTEKQQVFFNTVNAYTFTLYGGAGGGGKSYSLRWLAIALLMRWAARGFRNVRVGLFCEDYPSLEDRHISKIRREFPEWLGKYHEQRHEFTLRPEFGGGVLCLRNLDDPSKYLSSEFAAILVDELTKNTFETFNLLRFRLRWPGISDVKFAAATNPGGVGHGWVRQLWIDRDFPPELRDRAHEFAYVPAKATDNPHLTEAYYKELESLPEQLRRAYLEGDWDIFAGQAFTEWRRDIHVVKPFAIPKDWPRYRAGDWGYAKPYAIYWGAVSPDGFTYIYRELYGWGGQPNVGTRETASEVREKIKVIEAKAGAALGLPTEPIWRAVLDPACWAKQGHDGPSIAEEFMDEGRGVMWGKGDNDRKQGKARVHEALKVDANDKPSLYVFETCTHLIRTLPALPIADNDPEDVDTEAEDHAYDALRMLLMARPQAQKSVEAPGPANVEERVKRHIDRLFSGRKTRLDPSEYVGAVM